MEKLMEKLAGDVDYIRNRLDGHIDEENGRFDDIHGRITRLSESMAASKATHAREFEEEKRRHSFFVSAISAFVGGAVAWIVSRFG